MKKIIVMALGVTALCAAAKYFKITSFEDLTNFVSSKYKGLKGAIS